MKKFNIFSLLLLVFTFFPLAMIFYYGEGYKPNEMQVAALGFGVICGLLFWILMLVDCFKKNLSIPKKYFWLLILFVTGPFGGTIYFFIYFIFYFKNQVGRVSILNATFSSVSH